MKHDHHNQTFLLDGAPVANNPGARILEPVVKPKPKSHARKQVADLPGQCRFWNDADEIKSGIKIVALACHWSVTEADLVRVLYRSAKIAAKKFRHSIPFDMTREDFIEEIIVRMYREALKWRDRKKKSFDTYIRNTAFNRARDILRSDQLKNSGTVTAEQIAERAEELGLDPDALTPRQRKQIVTALRTKLVEYHAVFHKEPVCELQECLDTDDETE